jgi:PBP1b-binding outer membrane lipoprotein LpoB
MRDINKNMKRVNSILAIILLLMTGCVENKQSTDDIITVDVTKSYSLKKRTDSSGFYGCGIYCIGNEG